MALKFLNKKGWHTGSLRNIENVWKAEQKHEAEQKKLEELRKQILEERERNEFRQLQEQAGLVPKQERLEFLYDSGLAVGKSSESFPLSRPGETQKNEPENELSKLASAPGALFVEDKPASANETWRKLHTDPLLMIRQREQEALKQIKNNPVKMEMIKKSMEAKKLKKEEKKRKKAEKKKRKKENRKRETSIDSDSDTDTNNVGKKMCHEDKLKRGSANRDSEDETGKTLSNKQDIKNKRKHLEEPIGRHDSNLRIPSGREKQQERRYGHERLRSFIGSHDSNLQRSPGREKQQERRYEHERLRSPLRYRRHRSRSLSECEERHRSRSSSDYVGTLDHRQRHRSRSPSDFRERHRSRSPLEYQERRRSRSPPDHVKSLHHRQSHRSRSPSEYDRRQRSSLQNSQRHRSCLPSDNGRQRSHSPDTQKHRLPPDRRHNFALHSQGREYNSHARDTDSRPSREETSAVPDISSNPVSRPKYQAGKLSEEEKAAKLREMQMDAELHDEQRWQRLKKASDADAREAKEAARRSGKNFLDVTNKSVYGAEKGGSSTIEESVRRRTHYLQGSAAATEGNAFRR